MPASIGGTYVDLPSFSQLVMEPNVKVVGGPGMTLGDGDREPETIQLFLPVIVYKFWHNHKIFGKPFADFLEEEQIKVLPESVAVLPEVGKRLAGEAGGGALKKQVQRVDPNLLIDVTTITAALLMETKLGSSTVLKVQSRVGKTYIVNLLSRWRRFEAVFCLDLCYVTPIRHIKRAKPCRRSTFWKGLGGADAPQEKLLNV